MTGQQEHAGTPLSLTKDQIDKVESTKTEINIINLLNNMGLEEQNLIVSGAYNIEHLEKIFLSTLPREGTKVIVINEECALEKSRRLKISDKLDKESGKDQIYYNILDSCVKCNECIEYLGCPAINIRIIKKEAEQSDDILKPDTYEYFINQSACMPTICPGLCKEVCKDNMIKKTIIKTNNQNSCSK